MTQSRKFRVLDRAYNRSLEREERIIREKAQVSEIARLGKTAGADYLLVGTIREYWCRWTERKISLLNTVEWDYSARLVIEYRLIEMATSEIRMSNTLQVQGGQELLSALGIADPEKPFLEITRCLGGRVSEELLENVYPVIVMAVSGPVAIYLNQGGNRFRAGDEMILFQPQKSIRDPATDTPIRVDGQEIGKIRINAVRTKLAIAELRSGDIKVVQMGCLARPCLPSDEILTPPKIRSGSKFKWRKLYFPPP